MKLQFFKRGGKERESSPVEISRPLPSSLRIENPIQSAIDIWAMGKTPIDEVRGKLREQYHNMDDAEIESMIKRVVEIRERGSKTV